MMTIVLITSLFCLVFLVAALLLILADKARELLRQSALDWIEVWSKYHEKRIKLEKEQER